MTKVTCTGVKNVVFVTHSTFGYPRAVLSLEQGLTFLLLLLLLLFVMLVLLLLFVIIRDVTLRILPSLVMGSRYN